MRAQVSLAVMNLIFSYSQWGFAPPLSILQSIHASSVRRDLPVKAEAKTLLSTSAFSTSVATSLPALLIRRVMLALTFLYWLTHLAKFSSSCTPSQQIYQRDSIKAGKLRRPRNPIWSFNDFNSYQFIFI